MPTYTLIGGDDFTEASDTNLESHTPSGASALASNWTHLQWQISASAVVKAADDTLCQPYHAGTAYWNPYVIGPVCNAVQKSECIGFFSNTKSLILLAANAATYWNGYLVYFSTGANTYYIRRVDDGVPTTIASYFDTSTKNSTDVASLEVDGSGNFIFRINGTSKLTVTDTTYTTGKAGLAVTKTFTSAGLDNFSAYHEVSGGLKGSLIKGCLTNSRLFGVLS